MRYSLPATLSLIVGLCGCATNIGGPSDDDPFGRTSATSTELALTSSSGRVERSFSRGESLAIEAPMGDLAPRAIYLAEAVVRGEVISATEILTNIYGGVPLATVMHDIGEEGLIAPGETLEIRLLDDRGDLAAATQIEMFAPPALQIPGFNVQEVNPPHIFAADATGAPQNAYAVGGSGGDEVRGPVHIAGDGFPQLVAGDVVDVYVAVDSDDWIGRAFPVPGDASYIAGPIQVAVDTEGRIAPTPIFTPELTHVGIYDILVDVNRDGRFDRSVTASTKDGADGLGRVGFTVQYSQAWMAERTSRHIITNMAFDSHGRDGTWANDYMEGEPVFMYLNPPVMHQYHFSATKHIVAHRNFETFWNDPAAVDPACGGVPFEHLSQVSLELRTQTGCTNTSPTCFGPIDLPEGMDVGEPPEGGAPAEGEPELATFDVVFDRDGDGCYDIGEDLLDIVSDAVGGELISPERFLSLSAEDRVGFRVHRR
jgi:hypothetical protein